MSTHYPSASLPCRFVDRTFKETPRLDCHLFGEGIAMSRVRSQLYRIAPYVRMALITGESGTGKESAARALHDRSAGAEGPFIVCRATDLADALGTPGRTMPLLHRAQGGTLFLERLSEANMVQQDRLLQFLQQQNSLRSQRCEMRIVGASERDLRTLATTGRYLEELYRRIAAVEIALPSLRDRHDDFADLALHILEELGDTGSIDLDAMARLRRYAWPDNIRELKQVLFHASQQAGRCVIGSEHLPVFDRDEPQAERTLERLDSVVQRHVLEVLTRCSGNKLRAAEALGISRSTLYRMLEAMPPSFTANRSRTAEAVN